MSKCSWCGAEGKKVSTCYGCLVLYKCTKCQHEWQDAEIEKIYLEDKYTIYYSGGEMWIDRYDEPWMLPEDMSGNKWAYAMFNRIQELEKQVEELKSSYYSGC